MGTLVDRKPPSVIMAQVWQPSGTLTLVDRKPPSVIMAPMKAAMKAGSKAMTKGAIADALATKCELKKAVAGKVMNSLAEIATAEVKKAGIFTIPGLCRIKTRMKPATKAGKREI